MHTDQGDQKWESREDYDFLFFVLQKKGHQMCDHHVPEYYVAGSIRNPSIKGGEGGEFGMNIHDFFSP